MRSPKLSKDRSSDWYRYYAGYAPAFVEDALKTLAPDTTAVVMDPWNGSGTTTRVAHEQGFHAIGYDSNPALVLIGRARLLGSEVVESLEPLTDDILDHARTRDPREGSDPLEQWLSTESTQRARSIEQAIQHVLVEHNSYTPLVTQAALAGVSSLAAFFYVALFDSLRTTLRPFVGSNPTWVKVARPEERLILTRNQLEAGLRDAVGRLSSRLYDEPRAQSADDATVALAKSQDLPLEDDAVAAVITSPPYCTRIDYVAATRPELALLGLTDVQLRALREEMLGTPTIAADTPGVTTEWGAHATSLLKKIIAHPSHASKIYYQKYFVQYFDALWRSLQEIRRVVDPQGAVAIVVQDSYYKEIHVDLARIVQEMALELGWSNIGRDDFGIATTKAAIHPGTRAWRTTFSATESVLVLT